MTCVKIAVAAAMLAAVMAAQGAPDPEEVFRNPPQSAKTGVWWHWMGCNVTKDGIVKVKVHLFSPCLPNIRVYGTMHSVKGGWP